MSRPMNFYELQSLLDYIADFHSPDKVQVGQKSIKFILPYLDMRNQTCFGIILKGSTWTEEFQTHIPGKQPKESLFERVLSFLRNQKVQS